MILQKYKIDVNMDQVFIILWPSLKIINIFGLILSTKMFKSPYPPIPTSHKPINMDLLSLEHKVKKLKNYS